MNAYTDVYVANINSHLDFESLRLPAPHGIHKYQCVQKALDQVHAVLAQLKVAQQDAPSMSPQLRCTWIELFMLYHAWQHDRSQVNGQQTRELATSSTSAPVYEVQSGDAPSQSAPQQSPSLKAAPMESFAAELSQFVKLVRYTARHCLAPQDAEDIEQVHGAAYYRLRPLAIEQHTAAIRAGVVVPEVMAARIARAIVSHKAGMKCRKVNIFENICGTTSKGMPLIDGCPVVLSRANGFE